MSVLKGNIIHLTVSFLTDIVRYIFKGYTQLFVGARLKKKEKRRKYNGLTGRQKSLSRPDFLLGLRLNTETPTLEIVTCKLLLFKRPPI